MSEPAERLRWALAEHDKLLERVGKKRKELERVEQEVRAAVSRVAGHMAPLAEEASRLDEAIHARLDALAADKRRSRRERDQIRRVHRDLQKMGALSARESPETVFPPGHDSDGPCRCHEGGAGFERVASTPRATEPGAIRDLFRRLAEALHPDKVQDEEAKATRTEVMKEITVAYRERDFARLVEIERTWAASVPVAYGDRGDEVERRLAVLAQANDELRKQQREIDRQLRRLRNSEDGRLASALKRHGRTSGDGGIASVVGPVEEELETLRRVHDFVEAFGAGKITLAEFLAGPRRAEAETDDLSIILEDALTELASMMDAAVVSDVLQTAASPPRNRLELEARATAGLTHAAAPAQKGQSGSARWRRPRS